MTEHKIFYPGDRVQVCHSVTRVVIAYLRYYLALEEDDALIIFLMSRDVYEVVEVNGHGFEYTDAYGETIPGKGFHSHQQIKLAGVSTYLPLLSDWFELA